MTTIVKVNMNVCDKHTTIEVSKNDNDSFDLKVTTDCECVSRFANELESFTLSDVVDWPKGRIFERQVASMTTPNCLVASGILYAARIEGGLILASAARKAAFNSIEYVSHDE